MASGDGLPSGGRGPGGKVMEGIQFMSPVLRDRACIYTKNKLSEDSKGHSNMGELKLQVKEDTHKIHIQMKFEDLLAKKCFSAPIPKFPRYETTQQLLLKERNMAGIVFENIHFNHNVSFEGSVLECAKFRFDAVVRHVFRQF